MLVFNDLALRWLLGAKGDARPVDEIYEWLWNDMKIATQASDWADEPKIMELPEATGIHGTVWMVDEDELTRLTGWMQERDGS